MTPTLSQADLIRTNQRRRRRRARLLALGAHILPPDLGTISTAEFTRLVRRVKARARQPLIRAGTDYLRRQGLL